MTRRITIVALCVLLGACATSCARATYSYNDGKLVKEPRLRPGKGYSIGLAVSIGLGEQYKIKH